MQDKKSGIPAPIFKGERIEVVHLSIGGVWPSVQEFDDLGPAAKTKFETTFTVIDTMTREGKPIPQTRIEKLSSNPLILEIKAPQRGNQIYRAIATRDGNVIEVATFFEKKTQHLERRDRKRGEKRIKAAQHGENQ